MYTRMNSKWIRDLNAENEITPINPSVALTIVLKYQPTIDDCGFEILLPIKAT